MAKQITAKFGGMCGACGQPFSAGAQILWEKGRRSTHAKCPERSAGPASAPAASVDAAPFEVWETWAPMRGEAFRSALARTPGETRRYATKLPSLREGAQGTPEPGVYTVMGAGKWRYQNTEDNEDMGDMQGANWSGPLYLRRATPEEEQKDAERRLTEALPSIFAAIGGFAHRAQKRWAEQEMAEAEARPGYCRAVLQSHHDFRQRAGEKVDLWRGRDRDYSYRVRFELDGAVVYESHDYIYDWDQPLVYVGPRELLEPLVLAEAIVAWGWALQAFAGRHIAKGNTI